MFHLNHIHTLDMVEVVVAHGIGTHCVAGMEGLTPMNVPWLVWGSGNTVRAPVLVQTKDPSLSRDTSFRHNLRLSLATD